MTAPTAKDKARRPTIEWQVCGVCNYDCSYCIQSKRYRVGHPEDDEVEGFLRFFASLDAAWEIKMTGGEPFAFKAFMHRIIPGLVAETSHRISVLTNLSAPASVLDRFAAATQGRLDVVSASLHLEFTTISAFAEKALRLRRAMDPGASLVCNCVMVPGKLEEAREAQQELERQGLKFFPQLFKTKHGVFDYGTDDRRRLLPMIGEAPTPREANLSPSYRGKLCYTGVDYFVLTQRGDAWSCRTARRMDEGFMGNVLDGSFARMQGPHPCSYDICPCTVPANRSMIVGVGGA